MGYTSSVVIAINKTIMSQDLIDPIIPACLKNKPYSNDDKYACYWELNDWKWYNSYPDIQEIEAFFSKLDDMDPITLPTEDGRLITLHPFGAVRIGEDYGDSQTWGDPDDYEIYITARLDYPGSH